MLLSCAGLMPVAFAGVPADLVREEFQFENGGLRLHGEVFLPRAGRDLPGIALIQGSGASGTANRWARQFAEELARRGFAVLLPDKRGVGKSEGDWRTAGFEALAFDAVSSLNRLRAHRRVNRQRAGYMGLSQGGHIAPLAGSLDRNTAFVIDAVGSLVVMEEQLYHELENAYREHGLDDGTIEYLQELARFSFDYLRQPSDPAAWQRYIQRRSAIADSPLAAAVASWPDTREDAYWVFWGQIHDYDPLPYWEQLAVKRNVPCLILFGELDEQENIPVEASLARSRHLRADPDFTVEVYAGSGHGLFSPGTTTLRPDMLDRVAEWIRRTTGAATDPQSAAAVGPKKVAHVLR